MRKRPKIILLYLMILLSCTSIACERKLDLTHSPSTFVYIQQVIPDANIDMQYYSSNNFIGRPIVGYNQNIALLTSSAANALTAVDADLELQGYDIKIYDAYRPQKSVDYFMKWSYDLTDQRMKPEFYPNVDKEDLFSLGYLAARSAHSRGSAIDITLVDKATGQELDMGGHVDLLDPISSWGTTLITPEQFANRNILKNVMQAHGFKTITKEWWHWVYINETYPGTYWNFDVE